MPKDNSQSLIGVVSSEICENVYSIPWIPDELVDLEKKLC